MPTAKRGAGHALPRNLLPVSPSLFRRGGDLQLAPPPHPAATCLFSRSGSARDLIPAPAIRRKQLIRRAHCLIRGSDWLYHDREFQQKKEKRCRSMAPDTLGAAAWAPMPLAPAAGLPHDWTPYRHAGPCCSVRWTGERGGTGYRYCSSCSSSSPHLLAGYY